MPGDCLLFEVEVDRTAVEIDAQIDLTTVAVPVGDPVVIYAVIPAPGPPGPGSPFEVMTQAEYDALPVKDDDTVYIIKDE